MHSCLLVSDAYHMFRAKQMMKAPGHQPCTSRRGRTHSETTGGKRILAALRESFSYLLYKAHVR